MEAFSSLLAQAESPSRPHLETVEAHPVALPLQGDFAAGLRSSGGEAGVRGCFATGTHKASALPTGSFATGLRSQPHVVLVHCDFATGLRSGGDGTARGTEREGIRPVG